MTEALVFRKIQEISRKEADGKPPVFISRLEQETGLDKATVMHQLDKLKLKALIRFNDTSGVAITLTDLGKYADI